MPQRTITAAPRAAAITAQAPRRAMAFAVTTKAGTTTC